MLIKSMIPGSNTGSAAFSIRGLTSCFNCFRIFNDARFEYDAFISTLLSPSSISSSLSSSISRAEKLISNSMLGFLVAVDKEGLVPTSEVFTVLVQVSSSNHCSSLTVSCRCIASFNESCVKGIILDPIRNSSDILTLLASFRRRNFTFTSL